MTRVLNKGTAPRCHRCFHKGIQYNGPAEDGRPEFGCQQCGAFWTAGHDGGEYAKYLRERGTEVPTKQEVEAGEKGEGE